MSCGLSKRKFRSGSLYGAMLEVLCYCTVLLIATLEDPNSVYSPEQAIAQSTRDIDIERDIEV